MQSINLPAYVLAIVFLSGCVGLSRKETNPEPRLAIYHVRLGLEDQLEKTLDDTWKIYRSARVVTGKHIVLRVVESTAKGTSYYVEVFEWVGPFAAERPPVAITDAWKRLDSLCEPRDGDPAVQFRTARIVRPCASK